ncbi:MAG: hypothetical protein JWP00_2057 [Chloroflexi bacterium]|jgi:hypothetical protein|nr:hypothetical protein [Chloroflexota bacterium]
MPANGGDIRGVATATRKFTLWRITIKITNIPDLVRKLHSFSSPQRYYNIIPALFWVFLNKKAAFTSARRL